MKKILWICALAGLFPLLISCEKDSYEPTADEDPEVPIVEEPGIDTMFTDDGIGFVRTPEERFENLPDWPYAYQYVEIDGLRQAYAEAGPSDGPVVLMLHGQPSWSYLYRKMIPVLADSGYHVIAMDHLGFGRSDKPVDIASYSYVGHFNRVSRFIEQLNLSDIHLFGQDWGAVIGLHMVGQHPEWFEKVTIGNGFLPNVPAGQTIYPPVENPDSIENIPSLFAQYTPQQVPYYENCVRLIVEFDFAEWMVYTMKAESFTASEVLEGWTWTDLPAEVEAAYDAPFPSREYMAGARVFPSLLNETPGVTNGAWFGLSSFDKPFLTIWGANDPLDLGDCELQQALIDVVPGAKGMPHHRFPDASHYLQNDQGEEIARRMLAFYQGNYEGGNFRGDEEDMEEQEICESDTNEDPRQYCEFLMAYQRNGQFLAEVWGTQGLNNCPSGCLENVDLNAIQTENGALLVSLNGPRIWLPSGSADLPDVESRVFGGIEVRLLATINLNPDDLSHAGSTVSTTPYEENLVNRSTTYEYPAGTEVYELISPDGAIYTMQSVSLMVDPTLSQSDLPFLSSRLELPEGWLYLPRQLSEDLIMEVDGEATVITDNLGNTYQRRFAAERVGFEILQIKSAEEIIVWKGINISLEEFNALELPMGWYKNQPRSGDADAGSFSRSPDKDVDGEFTDEVHFGFSWRHNATVVDMDVDLPDDDDLLSGRFIAKYHNVQFNAGKTLKVLVSPENEYYVRISRDVNRTQEIPTTPSAWQEIEVTLAEDVIFQLPNPTLNIRADNEDSYQGPIAPALLGL